MTSIVLSQATQNLINKAVSAGPGQNNQNYIAAYDAISSEINANGQFNSGTAYWFSQAGAVNSQRYQSTPAGNFIWTYTQAAAASYGVTITPDQLLQASNKIAATVFQQIQSAGYQLNDDPNAPINFAPASIVKDDAGAGINELNQLNGTSLDDSIWGGTLFARTTLNDPTYFTDNNLNLTPGSADCEAVLSGLEGGLLGGAANPSFYAQGYAALNQIDGNAVQACLGANPKTFNDGSTLTPDNGAYVYATAPSPDGAMAVTAFSSTSAAQLTSTPDANGDGGSSIRFATPDEIAALNGTSLNAMQVTPNADGGFTFGSPQADPNGLVNQMTVNGTFGLAGLTVTNPTTGATANIALDNGSTTTLQEGRSVATDAPNEQATTTESNGQVTDSVFGQGAAVPAGAADFVDLVGAGTTATVDGTAPVALTAADQALVLDDAGATVNVGAGLTGLSVSGTADTIGFASGDRGAVSGSSNVLDLEGGDYALIDSGSGETVYNDVAADIVDLGGNTSTTIDGSGGYFGVLGTGVDVTASGEASNTLAGASYTLTGDGDTLSLGANASATLYGSGNTLTLDGGGTGGSAYSNIASGTDNVVDNDVAGDGINLGSNTSTTITGSGGYFGVLGTGVDVTASGETANTIQNASFTLQGSGDSVAVQQGATAQVDGSNDTLGLQGGNYALIDSGSGDTVDNDVAGDTVNLGSNTSTTITGSGGYFGIVGDRRARPARRRARRARGRTRRARTSSQATWRTSRWTRSACGRRTASCRSSRAWR